MAFKSKYLGKEVERKLDKIDDIPYKVSDLKNDAGYITQQSADSKYGTAEEVDEISEDVDELYAQVADVVNKIENIEKGELSWIEVQ